MPVGEATQGADVVILAIPKKSMPQLPTGIVDAAPRRVVVIDPSLPLDVAALFGCAVVTGVGAVVNTAQIRPGSTVAVVGLVFFGALGTLFFVSFYLQLVRGYSPLESGLLMVPFAARERFVGNVPPVTANVYGPVPPEAVKLWPV